MPRSRIEQANFRESLYQEHYAIFAGHRQFCHLTLMGVLIPTSKIHAHHIHPYSVYRHEAWVNHTHNGLLIHESVHRALHHQANQSGDQFGQAARIAMANFQEKSQLWRYASYRLRSGRLLLSAWEELLISKNLL
jgi:hypothetical protein